MPHSPLRRPHRSTAQRPLAGLRGLARPGLRGKAGAVAAMAVCAQRSISPKTMS